MTLSQPAVRAIPFFRYAHLFATQREEILAAVTDVMDRGAFILQSDLDEFERRFAAYVGAAHAIGVANGTDALIIALRACGVGTGDEVILPSHTYVASAAAVHFAGATPVLVDCRDDHLINPAAVEAAVTSRTRAVMPVQLNGRTCDMHALQATADRHGLRIVEDAAQGLGSKFRDRSAGTFGSAAGFSFYPAKVLGCFGDGGGLTTNDDATAREIRLLRDHGRDERGEVVTWGLNSRLDTLQAAVLNVKLDIFDAEIARRRAIASRYDAQLRDLDDLLLPPAPDADPDHFDVYQNYEVEAGARDALRRHLEQNGVRTIIQWAGRAVHQFEGLTVRTMDVSRTELLFRRCFLLPMNTSLADDEVDYICDSIRQFYGR
ncbi:MAG TPA: DegT/DnrJ/EryC1/StrS family aminotransferase [Gemmatimonadaceae bacterium]|nr:DegT/DnrJ/EryC1/StrS family aminotransferase [Gemmatimonadaceae bacterium]